MPSTHVRGTLTATGLHFGLGAQADLPDDPQLQVYSIAPIPNNQVLTAILTIPPPPPTTKKHLSALLKALATPGPTPQPRVPVSKPPPERIMPPVARRTRCIVSPVAGRTRCIVPPRGRSHALHCAPRGWSHALHRAPPVAGRARGIRPTGEYAAPRTWPGRCSAPVTFMYGRGCCLGAQRKEKGKGHERAQLSSVRSPQDDGVRFISRTEAEGGQSRQLLRIKSQQEAGYGSMHGNRGAQGMEQEAEWLSGIAVRPNGVSWTRQRRGQGWYPKAWAGRSWRATGWAKASREAPEEWAQLSSIWSEQNSHPVPDLFLVDKIFFLS